MQHVKHSAAFFTAILAATTAVHADDADQLEVIRAAYSDQVDSIDSLVATYEVQWHYIKTGAGEDRDAEGRNKVEWAREGAQRKLLIERSPIETDGVPIREWYSFDGRERTMGQWDRETGKRLRRVSITRGLTRSFFADLEPDDLVGVRMPNSEYSLAAMLGMQAAQLIGRDRVGDHACWKVDLGTPATPGRPVTWQYYGWFDPSVGYLPRRILAEYLPAAQQKNGRLTSWSIEFRIENFTRVFDANRPVRWFPGTVLNESVQELKTGMNKSRRKIEVASVEINQPVERSLFRLELPAGTKVVDYREPGKPKNYIVGDVAEIEQLAEIQQADVDRLARAGNKQPLDASPRRSSLFGWFLAASVLCVFAAAIVRWRRARLASHD